MNCLTRKLSALLLAFILLLPNPAWALRGEQPETETGLEEIKLALLDQQDPVRSTAQVLQGKLADALGLSTPITPPILSAAGVEEGDGSKDRFKSSQISFDGLIAAAREHGIEAFEIYKDRDDPRPATLAAKMAGNPLTDPDAVRGLDGEMRRIFGDQVDQQTYYLRIGAKEGWDGVWAEVVAAAGVEEIKSVLIVGSDADEIARVLVIVQEELIGVDIRILELPLEQGVSFQGADLAIATEPNLSAHEETILSLFPKGLIVPDSWETRLNERTLRQHLQRLQRAGVEEESSLAGLQSFLQREDVTGGAAQKGTAIRGRTLTGMGKQSYDAIVVDQFNLKTLLSELLSSLNGQGPFTWADVATGPGVAPREAARTYSNLQPLLVDAVPWVPDQYAPAVLSELDQRAQEVGAGGLFSEEFPIHLGDALKIDLKPLVTPGFPLQLVTMINALAYNRDPLGIVVNLFNQLEPGGLLLVNLYLPTKRKDTAKDQEEDYPRGDVLALFYGRLLDSLKAQGVDADFRIRDFRNMKPGERNSQGEVGPFNEYAVGIMLRRKAGQRLELLAPPSEVEEVTLPTARDVTYQVAWYGDNPSQVIRVAAAGVEELDPDVRSALIKFQNETYTSESIRLLMLTANLKRFDLSQRTQFLRALPWLPDEKKVNDLLRDLFTKNFLVAREIRRQFLAMVGENWDSPGAGAEPIIRTLLTRMPADDSAAVVLGFTKIMAMELLGGNRNISDAIALVAVNIGGTESSIREYREQATLENRDSYHRIARTHELISDAYEKTRKRLPSREIERSREIEDAYVFLSEAVAQTILADGPSASLILKRLEQGAGQQVYEFIRQGLAPLAASEDPQERWLALGRLGELEWTYADLLTVTHRSELSPRQHYELARQYREQQAALVRQQQKLLGLAPAAGVEENWTPDKVFDRLRPLLAVPPAKTLALDVEGVLTPGSPPGKPASSAMIQAVEQWLDGDPSRKLIVISADGLAKIRRRVVDLLQSQYQDRVYARSTIDPQGTTKGQILWSMEQQGLLVPATTLYVDDSVNHLRAFPNLDNWPGTVVSLDAHSRRLPDRDRVIQLVPPGETKPPNTDQIAQIIVLLEQAKSRVEISPGDSVGSVLDKAGIRLAAGVEELPESMVFPGQGIPASENRELRSGFVGDVVKAFQFHLAGVSVILSAFLRGELPFEQTEDLLLARPDAPQSRIKTREDARKGLVFAWVALRHQLTYTDPEYTDQVWWQPIFDYTFATAEQRAEVVFRSGILSEIGRVQGLRQRSFGGEDYLDQPPEIILREIDTLLDYQEPTAQEAGVEEGVIEIDQHQVPILAVAISPDGKTIASGDENGYLVIKREGPGDPLILDTGVTIVDLAFEPSGNVLAVGLGDGAIEFYNSETGEQFLGDPGLSAEPVKLRRFAWSLAFRDGHVAAIDHEAQIHSVQLETLQVTRLFEGLHLDLPMAGLARLALARLGETEVHRFAIGSGNEIVVVDDSPEPDQPVVVDRFDIGKTNVVYALAIDHSGRYVVVSNMDDTDSGNRIFLRDIEKKTTIELKGPHSQRVQAMAFSPDGTVLASAGKDGNLVFWNVPSGQVIGEINLGTPSERGSPVLLHDVVFASDGRSVLVSVEDRTGGKKKKNTVQRFTVPAAGVEEAQAAFRRLEQDKSPAWQELFGKRSVVLFPEQMNDFGVQADLAVILSDDAFINGQVYRVYSDSQLTHPEQDLIPWEPAGIGARQVIGSAREAGAGSGDLLLIQPEPGVFVDDIQGFLRDAGYADDLSDAPRVVLTDQAGLNRTPLSGLQWFAGGVGLPPVVFIDVGAQLTDQAGNSYTLLLMT